jgi:hypothetical protein
MMIIETSSIYYCKESTEQKKHEKQLNAHRIPTILEGIAAPPRAVSDHVVAGRHNDSTRCTCVQTADCHHSGECGICGNCLCVRKIAHLVRQQLAIHKELHQVVTGG